MNISLVANFTPHLFAIGMYHVYILKSQKDDSLYIGYTNDVNRRLEEHNKGSVTYTKDKRPWKLIYYESFLCYDDAIRREKNLKYFGRAYGQLKNRIQKSLNA